MTKKFYCQATLSLLLFVFAFSNTMALPYFKPPGKFVFKRGTNISHWLSQSKARGLDRINYFTAKDVKYLADLGFDHIRIPVDEEQLWKENGHQDEEAFSLLEHALNWCNQYKLDAVVDLHILRSHHFNEKEKPLWTKPEAQERFFLLARIVTDIKKISR